MGCLAIACSDSSVVDAPIVQDAAATSDVGGNPACGSCTDAGPRPTDARSDAVALVDASDARFDGSENGSDASSPDAAPDAALPSPWPPPLPAGAIDYYVSLTGSDTGTGSQSDPWLTIAHAASAIAPAGQPVTVHVAPGTYVLDSSSCITSGVSGTSSAPITFVSDVRGGAKIDGHGACLTIWSQTGDYTRIWGFDFTGIMYAPSDCTGSGGSVVLEADASGGNVDLGYSVIHDLPWGFASAVIMDPWGNSTYTGAPTSVHDNVFHDIGNTTPGTGCGPPNNYALYVASGTDTHVYNNLMVNLGTIGIHCWHAANNVHITNNTIVNAADTAILVGTGDGGYVVGATFDVTNNIVTSSNYGIFAEGNAPGSIATSSVFRNNLVFGNQNDWLYDDQGASTTLQAAGMAVTGTVTADPMFVSPSAGDYRLLAGSPAVDMGLATGAPDHDLDGFPRPLGAAVDIGAYERH
jgi:hypothetical protein